MAGSWVARAHLGMVCCLPQNIRPSCRLSTLRVLPREPDVYFDTVNNAGVITINRPSSLNALDLSVISKIFTTLREWEKTRSCVIVKGAGGKAFCAGGDIKQMADLVGEGSIMAYTEYNVNYLTKKYKIPFVSLIHGITMGGGLGLSVHGRYRVATEKTVVAMPETQIGVLPDVGMTYFLPRLRQHLGYYMGLTGRRFKDKDVVLSGIGTHFARSDRLVDLEIQLSRCADDAAIQQCLQSFSEPVGEFSLAAEMKDIDYCFSAETVEEITRRLSEINSEWSNETLKILQRMCPTMLKVTLRAFQIGEQLDLGECLKQEYRINARAFYSSNFREGVRARLIDRDDNPQWQPATLQEVTDEEILNYFNRLPEDMELIFYDTKGCKLLKA